MKIIKLTAFYTENQTIQNRRIKSKKLKNKKRLKNSLAKPQRSQSKKLGGLCVLV